MLGGEDAFPDRVHADSVVAFGHRRQHRAKVERRVLTKSPQGERGILAAAPRHDNWRSIATHCHSLIANGIGDAVLHEPIERVKIWGSEGTILYSDETRTIGDRYASGAHELAGRVRPVADPAGVDPGAAPAASWTEREQLMQRSLDVSDHERRPTSHPASSSSQAAPPR